MLLLPVPDVDGIAKTKQIVFNRTGHTPTDEEAAKLLGGAMRYLYLLRRLDEQLRADWQGPLPAPPSPSDSTTMKSEADEGFADEVTSATGHSSKELHEKAVPPRC
jgi:hypothetical protein